MKVILKTTLLFALLLVSRDIRSDQLIFEHIGVAEGLSQSSVTAIAQDSIGRIWIGTRDGLNLYNGSTIQAIKEIKGESNSLLGHYVNDIKINGEDLWIVTKSGISLLNLRDFQFTRYPREDLITSVLYKDMILVGTKSGLLVLHPEHKTFTLSDILPNSYISISHLNVDESHGTLWISTNQGLYMRLQNNITIKVLNVKASVSFIDSNGRIWVGTSDQGVFVLNAQREIIKHFYHDKEKHSIASNIVRDIKEDGYGNIWIGTFDGLSIIDNTNESITNYTKNENEESSLSHNSIYAILKDKQNCMWIGTFFGGLSQYSHDFYKRYTVGSEGTSYGVIGRIIEDHSANLWIATEGGGLNYYNCKTNKFKHYLYEEGKSGLSQRNIKSLLLKDKNTLLIGTHYGGLNILDIKSGNIKVYKNNPNDAKSIPGNIVRDIIPYGDVFLLATDKGVVEFNYNKESFTLFFDKEKRRPIQGLVKCLLEDSFGTLWIGTEDYGLYAYTKENGKLKRYTATQEANSIGSNNISCVFEDHLFRLWIGTAGGGVNQYLRDKDSFVTYDEVTHNLPSNFIFGIKESNYGGLWISTQKGLSLFNVDKNKVHNYSQENGFPINELNDGGLYLTNDGELFVGGLNGLISFNENTALNEKQQFNLVFESLIVNNKEVKPHDDTKILNNTLAYTDKIKLKPSHVVFTVNYSACNYIRTNKNTYRYKLENFDKEWVDAGSRTSVTYTNLYPGTYVLRVQSLNGIEKSIVEEKSLVIEIIPPIYITWYAIILYIIIIFIIFWQIKRTYRKRIELENKIEIEQKEKNQIELLNQKKLDFFTNVSHEFRTPLALISSSLESILDKKTGVKDNDNKILSAYKNVVCLNNLISELLDFRKIDSGYSKLEVSEIELSQFLDDIYLSFIDYAKSHSIEFSYTSEIENLTLWFNRTKMEKVFYNLISNAFKFVYDIDGKISISVVEMPGYVEFLIKDNGIGIPQEKIDNIFNYYYQIDNIEFYPKRKGSGIGLALCKSIIEEHHGEILVASSDYGTTFTIRLLKGKDHYLEDNFSTEQSVQVVRSLKVFDGHEAYIDCQDNEIEPLERSISILIVEDNYEMRMILKDIFRYDYKIIEAEDGLIGIKMAIEEQPDLIISDVMMPHRSGIQLCSTLKRNFQTSHIPIVLLTAKAAEESQIEGIDTGADDYIIKPFSNKLLKAKVKNLIQNRLLLQQKFKQQLNFDLPEMTTNLSEMDLEFLQKAKDIVEENLDNTEFLSQDFAFQIGVSRTKLFNKIKGITGMTLNDFILSIRLEKAQHIFMASNYEKSISEVAYSVGFSSAGYFTKCFKKQFGVSPSDYIASLSGKN